MKDSLLVFDRVQAGYGLGDVLKGLSFDVKRGQILGVVGPNGSGKTTMLNVAAGLLRHSGGKVYMEGREISRLSVDARCRVGIGRTFQIPRPFSRMTVYENVLVPMVFSGGFSEREAERPVLDILELTGLRPLMGEEAGRLTLLDRKRLEIARAAAGRPKLLLLDEVAAGLTGEEIPQLIAIIHRLRSMGITMLWIEHVLDVILNGTDALMCMADGQNVLLGPPEEVLASDIVADLYLGREQE